MVLSVGLIWELSIAGAGAPASAQVPEAPAAVSTPASGILLPPSGTSTPTAGTLIPTQLTTEPYAPVFGLQPRVPTPGATTQFLPVLPPPPSQSHLPAVLATPELTAPRPLLELQPTLAFSEQYSDNFNLTPTDHVENFRSLLTPGLLVGISGPRTRGAVSATFGVAQDSAAAAGDVGFFPTVSAAIKHVFDPRLSVSLVDRFTRSDEPALANPFGLRQQRETFASNTLSLSVDWLLDRVATQGYYQLSTFFDGTNTLSNVLGVNASTPIGPLMIARAGYEFSDIQNSGALENQSTGNLFWASLARRVGRLTSVGISGSYSLQSFDSTRIGNISVFATYALPERLSVSASLGTSVLRSDSGDDALLTTDISASYRFGKVVVSLAIFQDVNQTGLQGENFGIVLTRSYTGRVGYAVTPFIDTGLRVSYNDNAFTGVGNSAGNPDSKTLSATVGLVWRARRWLNVGPDYTFTRYNSSDVSGSAANENRVTLTLTGSF